MIHHSAPSDDSQTYPGTRPVDGHLDVIDTEILSMFLDNGSESLIVGEGLGQFGNLAASYGVIAETSNPSEGDSFFDLFCEAYANGLYLYNQTPVRMEALVDKIPPDGAVYTFTGCIPAYTSPIPGQGTLIGYIVQADFTVMKPSEVPTVSQWGMMLLGLMLLAVGTIAVIRKKRVVTSIAT